MIGRKLKILISTLALTLLCTNVAFAFNWGPNGLNKARSSWGLFL